jgi:Flp pilus assembly protein TadG
MTHRRSTNTFKPKHSAQYGASAVEMALLLPLLLLMLDGVLELGLVMHNQSILTSATQVAARAGIASGIEKLTTAQISAIVSSYCTESLISLSPTSPPAVTITQAADPVYPNPLQVTVHYTFKGLLVGGVLTAFQASPVLTATTVMYNE